MPLLEHRSAEGPTLHMHMALQQITGPAGLLTTVHK